MDSLPGPRRAFVVVMFLALLAAFIPSLSVIPAAHAKPSSAASSFINVSPPSTAPGNSVQIQACFTGTGGGIATVYLVAVGTTTPQYSTTTYNLDANNCLGPTQFNTGAAPAAPAGNYLVVATYATQTLYGSLSLSGGPTLLTIVSPTNPIPANTNTPVSLSGSGFAVNAPITVWVATAANPNVVLNGTQIVLGTSNGTGFFTAGYSVNLPAGSYFIYASDGTHTDVGEIVVSGGVSPGPYLLSVLPSTNLYTGESVTVSGCFFTPGELVKLYLSTTPNTSGIVTTYVTSVIASPGGCLGTSGANFIVPTVLTAGAYYIVAVGQSSGVVGSGAVTVNLSAPTTNTLTVVPSVAYAGQLVTASGCGYITSPLEQVQIVVVPTGGGAQVISTSTAPTVTSAGCISVTFYAPSYGTYTVKVSGLSSGNVDIGSLTVSSCSIYGNNCYCNNTNTNCYCNTNNTNCNCNVYINTCNCSTYFNNCGCALYPTNCSCGYYNNLYNNCCLSGYSNCYIYPTPPSNPAPSPAPSVIATLTAQPPNVAPGQTITLTGAYFYAGGSVTITGLGAGGGVTVTASSSGGFTATLTVPAGTAIGNYTITAQDAYGHVATATVYVTVSGATLIATAAVADVGQPFTVTGSGFGANEQVTLSLGVPSAAPYAITSPNTVNIYSTTSSGSFTATYVVPNLPTGPYVLIALGQTSRIEAIIPFNVDPPVLKGPEPSSPSTSPSTAPSANNAALPSVASVSTTTYFAEGYTGTAASNGKASFRERLDIYNNRLEDSNVTITYYVLDPATGERSTLVKHMIVSGHSTAFRNVNTDVGNDRQVSIVVRADNGVVAEVVISRVDIDGQVLDNASSTGTPSADTTWYLAEGYTGESLQEYVTLFNPGSGDAHAQVKYLPTDTPAPAAQAVTVPAHGQVTINVRSAYNSLAPQGSKSIGIQVTSDSEIVVDRAMYWGAGSGSGKFGYSFGPGQTAGHTNQHFAFLPTSDGSQSFVTVLNPEGSSSHLTLVLRNGSGTVVKTLTATVGPRQRYTFALATVLTNAGALSGDLSSSDTAVVAEAGIYFGGSPNFGSHPGIVVQGVSGRGVGARAEVASRNGSLYVYNPSADAIRVQVSVTDSNGTTVVFDGTVTGYATKVVALPQGTNPRGVQVRASGGVTGTLLNGGTGQFTAWGGSLS